MKIYKNVRLTLSLVALLGAGLVVAGFSADQRVWTHSGICDASGVVSIDGNHFAVADDELNMLLVYAAGEAGGAEESFELSSFLNVVTEKKTTAKKKQPGKRNKKKKEQKDKGNRVKKTKAREVDIEGATRLGDVVYWIASHGRKASGKPAQERMRLFATSIEVRDGRPRLIPAGIPYANLLEDLLADDRYADFGLAEAARKAPKDTGGLNIEALTDRRDGTLLIGFRSPLIDGKALIAPLRNPAEVVTGQKSLFGAPILVDLAGRGMRGLASHQDTYLIVANDPEGDQHRPALFIWDGAGVPDEIESVEFGSFNPEAVAIFPDESGGKVLMLSDDGSLEIGQERCKDLKDLSQRRFRSSLVTHPRFSFFQ